jgi:hypothetical protein
MDETPDKNDSDPDPTDEDEAQEKAAKQSSAHPGYSRYRKTRQFGG